MNGREDRLEKLKYVEISTIKLAKGNRLQANCWIEYRSSGICH